MAKYPSSDSKVQRSYTEEQLPALDKIKLVNSVNYKHHPTKVGCFAN